MERLNIRAVATEAFNCYRTHFVELLKVVTLPALAHTTVLFVSGQAAETSDFLPWIVQLLMAFIVALAALSCHRIILLGSGWVPPLGANGRHLRDWKFVGTGLTLFFIYYAVLIVTYNFGLGPVTSFFDLHFGTKFGGSLIVGLISWVPPLYVLSRLSIRLPAIAIDRPLRLIDAWRLSKGNGLQLLILVGALPWLLNFAQRTVARLFDAGVDFVSVKALLFWLLFPLEIALLSISYQRLSRTP